MLSQGVVEDVEGEVVPQGVEGLALLVIRLHRADSLVELQGQLGEEQVQHWLANPRHLPGLELVQQQAEVTVLAVFLKPEIFPNKEEFTLQIQILNYTYYTSIRLLYTF